MAKFQNYLISRMAVKNSSFPVFSSRKLIATAGALFIFALIFSYKKQFNFGLYQDEIHYYATALKFSEQALPSIELLKNFDELNTPIPFILGGWVINLFGEDVRLLYPTKNLSLKRESRYLW